MQVIPVIDIRNGVAVRAIAGRRPEYRPLATPLARTSAPLDVARGLMSLHPFSALYIADLDAIEGRGANCAAIASISDAFSQVQIWVDAGVRRQEDMERVRAIANVSVVIGSEALASIDDLAAFEANAHSILSLDFTGDAFLGPEALVSTPGRWPQSVIAMTLARVGSNEGPDFARFEHIRAAAAGRAVYAAGGVRSVGDLRRLEAMGAAGALVASALHDGRLTAADLVRLRSK